MKARKYFDIAVLFSLLSFSPVKTIAQEIKEKEPLIEILVDKSDRKTYVYEDGNLIREFLVGIGRPECQTPIGKFKILNKRKNPYWAPPDREWAREARKHVNENGVIPYGHPWNPLRHYWIGLGKGIGFHGIANDKGIGEKSSGGCLRTKLDDLEYLVENIPIGTIVNIQE